MMRIYVLFHYSVQRIPPTCPANPPRTAVQICVQKRHRMLSGRLLWPVLCATFRALCGR